MLGAETRDGWLPNPCQPRLLYIGFSRGRLLTSHVVGRYIKARQVGLAVSDEEFKHRTSNLSEAGKCQCGMEANIIPYGARSVAECARHHESYADLGDCGILPPALYIIPRNYLQRPRRRPCVGMCGYYSLVTVCVLL